MLIPSLMVIAGILLLLFGGDSLVKGAVAIAHHLRISPTVVGLTVVAAGTSAPELVVSLSAAFQGTPDLAMGNVVGSNIYNIALILGITAMLQPLHIQGNTVKLEWPILFLSACLAHLLGRDGEIDRMEGSFFVIGLLTFIAWTVHLARYQSTDATVEAASEVAADGEGVSLGMAWVYAIAGGVMLTLGARVMVGGAITIAQLVGVSERIIGLTIVALGTSLPELVASTVAAMKNEADIAVANVIGSNLFNTLGILGVTATVLPVPVNPKTLSIDNPWMVGLTLLMLPLMLRQKRLGRLEGALLLSLMLCYSMLLYWMT